MRRQLRKELELGADQDDADEIAFSVLDEWLTDREDDDGDDYEDGEDLDDEDQDDADD